MCLQPHSGWGDIVMAFNDAVKEALPDYAKDTKLNLDAVLLRSTLNADVAMG